MHLDHACEESHQNWKFESRFIKNKPLMWISSVIWYHHSEEVYFRHWINSNVKAWMTAFQIHHRYCCALALSRIYAILFMANANCSPYALIWWTRKARTCSGELKTRLREMEAVRKMCSLHFGWPCWTSLKMATLKVRLELGIMVGDGPIYRVWISFGALLAKRKECVVWWEGPRINFLRHTLNVI